MNKILVFCLTTITVLTASAEWSSLGKGWRLTVGPSMNAAARSSVRVRGAALNSALPGVRMPVGDNKATAQSKGNALERGDRLEFPNGGFIEPNDSANISGETWNWRMPASAFDGMTISGSHPYSQIDSLSTSNRGTDHRNNDRDAMLGFSLGFDKEIGRWGDFGVDFGFLFSYYRKHGMVKTNASMSRTVKYEKGDYVTDVAIDPEVASDPWFANADGSYGSGSFDGPGPVLLLDGVSHSLANVSQWSETDTAHISLRGDYEEYSLLFALKPWYEVCDWFRIFGTIGLELSRSALDMHGGLWVDGTRVRGAHSTSDWDLCGVAGLGGMFRFKNICLGVDAMTRFGDDRLHIRAPGIDGRVNRADLTCRVWLGYEF